MGFESLKPWGTRGDFGFLTKCHDEFIMQAAFENGTNSSAPLKTTASTNPHE